MILYLYIVCADWLNAHPVKAVLRGALLIIAAFLALLFGAVASSIASDVAGCAS